MLLSLAMRKRQISITELVNKMPSKVLRNTLSLRALMGCDSLISLFQTWKKNALEGLYSGEFILSGLGADHTQQVFKLLKRSERFTARLYGDISDATEAGTDCMSI